MKTQAYIKLYNVNNVEIKTIVVHSENQLKAREGAHKALHLPHIAALINKGYKAVIEG